jgi:hypothetical protein
MPLLMASNTRFSPWAFAHAPSKLRFDLARNHDNTIQVAEDGIAGTDIDATNPDWATEIDHGAACPLILRIRRQKLVSVAKQIERVADHGGEQFATGPREEIFLRSPGKRHGRYACYIWTQAASTASGPPATVLTLPHGTAQRLASPFCPSRVS